MRETKDQTIERLKGVIEEQKKEMTEIKKDRKRLNYAVDRLERQIQKLSTQSSKEDIERIKELESQIEELKSAIETKDAEMAKEEADKGNAIGIYRINIAWIVKPEVDLYKIEKLEQMFSEIGLKHIDREETKFPYHTEIVIEYRFKGTYEGYLMLKRCAMALLDILDKEGQEYNIAVYGKKLEWLTEL